MKLVVVIETGHIAIDGEAHDCDLSKVVSDLVDARTAQIHWNGSHGEVPRTSRVAGRVDFEHFDDATLITPFVAAFKARQAEVAAEKAKAEALAAAEKKAREDEERKVEAAR